MTYAEKRQLVTLRRYYTIRGDGVALVNLRALARSYRFKKSLHGYLEKQEEK